MTRNALFSRGVLMTLALTAVACGTGQEADSADDADQSVESTSNESALTSELSDEVAQPMSATATDLANAAGTRVASHVQPAGCLTVTKSAATVTYVFNDCTGPYGMVHVTGTVVAVYSRTNSGQVQAVITGTGVKVNNATVDLNSTVLASQSGSTKTAQVTTDAKGTGPRGAPVTRQGAYTVTYDSSTECITVNGTWQTTVALRKASTVVSDYQRCKGSCPAAGGKIVHTAAGARGAVTTLTYDGSAVAKWTVEGGRSGTVNLACGVK